MPKGTGKALAVNFPGVLSKLSGIAKGAVAAATLYQKIKDLLYQADRAAVVLDRISKGDQKALERAGSVSGALRAAMKSLGLNPDDTIE